MFENPFRQMPRVSQDRPCPVCGKPDWCLAEPDGSKAICPRTEAGAVKNCGEAGWLHILDPRVERSMERVERPKPEVPSPKPRFFQELINVTPPPRSEVLDQFAKSLSVTAESLARLNARSFNDGTSWFPERDESGLVIGINKRFPDGSKKRWFHSRAGLTYADDWDTGSGPLLLPEGASDTCALMSLGLSAIGRPSNRAGCALLGKMLQNFERPIVVLGENDEKFDGRWPGKEGAIHTAIELAKRLSRTVHWALAPDRAKDARDWLKRHGGTEPARLANVFLEGLALESVSPPPTIRTNRPRGPTVALTEYRQAMAQARLTSLDQPAIYLDRSPTGAGKSYADRAALHSVLSTGAG